MLTTHLSGDWPPPLTNGYQTLMYEDGTHLYEKVCSTDVDKHRFSGKFYNAAEEIFQRALKAFQDRRQ